MRLHLTLLVTTLIGIGLLASLLIAATIIDRPIALDAAQQMILVITPGWNAVDGTLQRYERGAAKQPWRAVGEPVAIVVGRNGMAWGKGLHGNGPSAASGQDSAGPIKREGDGRAPAGIFGLSRAFGYAAKDEAGQIKLPYVQAVPSLECVDDVKSAYYNRVLDRRSVAKPDWDSSEQMRRKDDFYRWGVVVDHNAGGEPAGGSCIFLHIWAGAGHGTAGCTAMTQAKMEEVIGWLRPEARPVLVQLPRGEFTRLRSAWSLP